MSLRAGSAFAIGAILVGCGLPALPESDGSDGSGGRTSTATSAAHTTAETASSTATAQMSTSTVSTTSGGGVPPTIAIVSPPPGIELDRRVFLLRVTVTAPDGATIVVSREGTSVGTADIEPSPRAVDVDVSVELARGANALDVAIVDGTGGRSAASLFVFAGRTVAATLSGVHVADEAEVVSWGGGDPEPRVVTHVAPVTAIAAGQDALLVLDADGNVSEAPAGAIVDGLGDVVSIALGGGHALALRGDGTVAAWGANALGQLGTGTVAPSATPVTVPDLDDVVAIAAASETSFALRRDGNVFAWGGNDKGILGTGNEDAFAHPSPALVPGLVDVVGIAAGRGHVVVVDRAGALRTWGNGASGQLGNGASGILAVATQPTLISTPRRSSTCRRRETSASPSGRAGRSTAGGRTRAGSSASVTRRSGRRPPPR